ncbi:Homeodomain-like protein [Artemisia annua]|uniref:Homeodomain-like protein n=1 Tax=Artemisia annua TaxID=35608 RepID=A0A2U1N242_ARTAN|nr:Homeodomain-like protein [Artemisia annua]
MTRRCSHCSNNGHNSRTCPTRDTTTGGGVKLFGVRLTEGGGSIMKKSASMGNLSALYHPSSSSSSPVAVSPNNGGSPASSDRIDGGGGGGGGYLSDDPKRRAVAVDRKKGTPWTEEEHRLFLLGLQKLGKGDWRGIARNYVLSRTPTQVASHAQKYFIRQCNSTRRKRRSSLFDMAPDTVEESPEDQFVLPPAAGADHPDNNPCSLKLSLNPDSDQSMEAAAPTETLEQDIKEETSTTVKSDQLPPTMPAFYPAYIPIPFQVWPSTMTPLEEPTNNNNTGPDGSYHRVLKPIPVLSKEPVNLDELVGKSSQLSLKDTDHHYIEPSSLSLTLMTEPSRQSAFHASIPVVGSSGKDKGAGNGFLAI